MKNSRSLNSQQEVVFVKAKIDSGSDEDNYKKFAIDPNITTFNAFLGLLAKCFDLLSDFSVSYLAADDYGEQFYVPLQSDWDLDAAILTSSDPALRIKINVKQLPIDLRDWDIVVPADLRFGLRRGFSLRGAQPITHAARRMGVHANSLLSTFSERVGRTVSNVQRAIGLKTDFENYADQLTKPPMSDIEFREYLDVIGRVTHLDRFYWDVYRGGLEPSLRKVGWRLLLSVFPADTTGQERISLLESKTRQYVTMKEAWKRSYVQGRLTEQQLATLASVSIDVVRTDWTNAYYCGEENRHRVCQLFDLLATYCIYHPSVGYNQGMSDLASPLLITQQDEATAYLCFCALMQRLHVNFSHSSSCGLIAKMQHLYALIVQTDPRLACFLRMHGLADMYFTQRWLLLELKREFMFNDCLHLFEIQWASCASLRLADEATHQHTSNSKSVGHLVLAEMTVASFESQPNDQQFVQRYTARDVSLINSLVGSDYVVRLPGSADGQLKRLACLDISRRAEDISRFRVAAMSHTRSLDLDSDRPPVTTPYDPLAQKHNNFPPMSEDPVLELGHEVLCENDPEQTVNTPPQQQPMELQKSDSSFDTELPQCLPSGRRLPGPQQLGYGNPFLLFLCLSLLLEYREDIFAQVKDASDMISFFQHRAKQHDLARVVHRARMHYNRYLQDHGFSPA